MKRPAFQFYPADWRKDMALQSCSIAARGLWVDMLCVAHECEPYGHLTVNGKPMTAAQIGRHTGLTQREAEKLIAELDGAGVTSRTAEGTIYSRRMVRDEDLRNRRAEGGKAGSEHGIKGAEYGVKGGRPANGRGVSEPPLKPPPSSSSSSSASAIPSEANASAPVAPDPTPREVVFALGLPMLMAASVPEERGRNFLGLLLRCNEVGAVADAVQRCAKEGAIQPIAYLQGCLKTSKAKASAHSGFAAKDYRDGVTEDGTIAF